MQRVLDDIDAVTSETCDMADLATDMLERSIQAITEGDVDLADTIIADQAAIEAFDEGIEAAAIRILTLYQPTAVDARTISTVLKSITYLERIAKYSTNVANATRYLSDRPSYDISGCIGPVGEIALGMVRLVVRGFEERTTEGLDRLAEMDDRLDRMMRESLMSVVSFINTHENSADVCTYYISVLKFYERVGDHACKMGEKVHYMVTGEHISIDRGRSQRQESPGAPAPGETDYRKPVKEGDIPRFLTP